MDKHKHWCSKKLPNRLRSKKGNKVSHCNFCLLLELRVAIITHQIATPTSLRGHFLTVTSMDDTTFVLDNVDDMQQLLERKMMFCLYIHLHT